MLHDFEYDEGLNINEECIAELNSIIDELSNKEIISARTESKAIAKERKNLKSN